jgi:hypothetical protein
MVAIANFNTREQTVRRRLRRQNTRQYFKEDGWTENPEEAKCFSDALEAAETCARCGLSDVELALQMGSPASELFCTPVR